MVSGQQLSELIREGKNDALGIQLKADASIAMLRTDQGISLLQFATYCQNMLAVELLRQYHTHLNIFEAASLGNRTKVKEQLSIDPDLLNAYSPDGFTPLGLACFFGHAAVVKLLLEKGADVNKASQNAFKVAPIHSACAISHLEISRMLLEAGANPNVAQSSGVTPLHSAAHHGQTRLVKLLLKHGADVRAKMENGKNPLDMAFEGNFSETADVLERWAEK